MLFLSKYDVLGKITGDDTGCLFRAKTCTGNNDVILKFSTKTHRENNGTALKHAYNICNNLSGNGIPRYLQLETFNGGAVAVLENAEGEIFEHFLINNRLNIENLLKIAISIVEILEVLHQNAIVHLGICPSNFIINAETLELKLLDFSKAFYTNVEDEKMSRGLEGLDLAYISPEQSGRLNNGIDIRKWS